MRLPTFRTLSLALAAACSVAGSPALAADRRVMIINDTGYSIVRFYASSQDSDSWEEDILGTDTLRAGQRVRINIDDGSGACIYDFKAVFSDGDVMMRRGINVCRISSYRYR